MKKSALLLSLLSGLVSLNASAYIHTYVGASLAIENIYANSASHYRAWLPGVFFGYGGMYDKDFYIAGELSASYAVTLTNDYLNRSDSMRMTPVISLSVLPGIMLLPGAVGFVRLGLAEAYLPAPGSWRPGALFGLGLDVNFTPCWSVRTEYNYYVYRGVDAGTPRNDLFALSAVYMFDT
jgi:opacity protein-like surface antigen